MTARRPCGGEFARQLCLRGRDLACLAFEPVAEKDAFVARGLALACARPRTRRRARTASLYSDAAKTGSSGFGDSLAGSFSAATAPAGRSSLKRLAIARASASVVGIRHRRAGPDHRRIVARHVRDAERHKPRRMCVTRKPSALDARQVLSHRVHLGDIGARAKQRPRHCLLLLQRQAMRRRDPVGGGAAGDQHQHEIVFVPLRRRASACVLRRRARPDPASGGRLPPSRSLAAAVHSRDARPQSLTAAPLGNPRLEIMLLGDLGHRARSLAGGKHDQPSHLWWSGQERRQGLRRMRGRHGIAEQGLEKISRCVLHGALSREFQQGDQTPHYRKVYALLQ